MLMRHDPATVFLAQPDRQAQAVVGILLEFFLRSAAEQCVGECDVLTGGDVERIDLELGALSLPLEEGRPSLAVGIDAANPASAVRRTSLCRWHGRRERRQGRLRAPRPAGRTTPSLASMTLPSVMFSVTTNFLMLMPLRRFLHEDRVGTPIHRRANRRELIWRQISVRSKLR